MNKFISNTGKFIGGYFVLNEKATNTTFVKSDGFAITCKSEKGLLNALLMLIRDANKYIKICSFIIDNKEIVDSLLSKLKEGAVAVFILTAVDDKKIKSDILDEDENAELSKSRHFEFIDALVKAGAHIRASSNAHAKFVVKDGTEGLIMSANLTEPSLNNNEKGKYPNDESGIMLDQHSEVKTVERIFDSIFLYGTEFQRFINLSDKTQLISKNENEILETDFPSHESNVLWTYDTFHQSIYNKLNSVVAKCNTKINISTYSIVELNNLSELVENIKSFCNRNGRLKIFCRAMNHRLDHINACKQLAELGVEIYGDMFNHSKGISIDDTEGIIFTANIDGKHGLKSGFEIGYQFNTEHKAFSGFSSFLEYQLQTAPFVFKLLPNKIELFEYYQKWYSDKEIKATQVFPEIFEIKFRSNSLYAKEFEDGITNYPIFFTPLNRPDKNEIQIKINGKAYLIDKLNENTFTVKQQLHFRDVVKSEEYMLFYNKINLTNYES